MKNYVVIDFETTGLDYKTNQITEVALKKLDENFEEIGSFHTIVKLNEGQEIDPYVVELTGLTKDTLEDGMRELDAMLTVNNFIDNDTVVVAQYVPFDLAYLSKYGIEPTHFICTKSLTSQMEPHESSSLKPTCERLGISLDNPHRAFADVEATVEVLKIRMKQDIKFVENYIVKSPDRDLNFIPKHTIEVLNKEDFMNEKR